MRCSHLRRLVAAAFGPRSKPDRAEGRLQLSFRAHVVALVIAGVLPLAGLGVYSMLQLAAAEHTADESEIVGTARVVAATIEHHFRHHLMTLRALVTRFSRDAADMDDFYGECAALAAENGGWILLADSEGRQIFNTKRPLGATLPPTTRSREFAKAVATGEPAISNLITGTIDPQPQFTVYQPIVKNGSVTRVLAMTFPTRRLNALLRAQHLPDEWMLAAIDRNGTIIANPDDMAPVLGQKASPEILALSAEQREGFLRLTNRRGIAVYVGAARSELSGWTMVVGIPAAIIDAPLHQTLWRFGVLGGALLLLALGAAGLIGGRLATAMKRLAGTARALARHEPMPVVNSTVREVNRAARALRDAGKALAESEAQLRRSQQHLALAQRVSRTGSVLYDIKSGVSEWSDELYRILGLERGAKPPTITTLLESVHEEDRAALVETQRAVLQGERRPPREYRVVRPDGTLRTVYREVEPLFDEAGQASQLVITFHDVTEQRAAEERQRQLEQKLLHAQQREATRLRESEARLRRSQQHLALAQRVSQTGSVLYDIANESEEWSDELYRINGLERGEQPATFATVLALVLKEDRAKLIAVKAAIQHGEQPPPIQYRLRRPDGELRTILLDVAPLGDDEGPPSQVVVTLRDVTELRAAEEQLRRSQQHLALAQRVSQTGSVLHDVKTGIGEWSDELYRILGLERGARPATVATFLERVHEEDRAALVETQEALLRGEKRSPREYRIVRPDGTVRMIHREVEPLFDEVGQTSQVVITLHDVTELRAAQERERDLERQLLHAQKLEALGTLAGGVAHDLNNTLVPVLGLAQLTMKRLPEGSREQANLATILKAGERARDLVRQILAFSRKEASTRQPVDLAALLRDSLRMLASSLPATIHIDEAIEDVPLVLADASQLHQILINLVINAAHAIGGKMGRIAVTLDTQSHPLPDATDRAVRVPAVHLAVQDTGCGMDEATRQRIFEPFFTTKPVGEGTGLGLSVVHGIVAQHGGKIAVESRPGEGTRFDIYLPALSGEEEARQLETAALAI